MAKISLKSILEAEEKEDKVDENDTDQVDENDEKIDENDDQVDENDAWASKVNGERTSASRAGDKVYKEKEDQVDENDEKVDENDDEDKLDEAFNQVLPKPGALRKESESEPNDAAKKLDGEGKPGETDVINDRLEKESKPGETKQATGGTTGDTKDRPNVTESDEEKVDEDEKEKIEEEDDEDLLLIEDEDKVDEAKGKKRSKKESADEKTDESDDEKVDESDDEKKDESDDEKVDEEDCIDVKVDEAVLDRMLKVLKVDESELATFKDVLRGAIVESVRVTSAKAVKRARKQIVSEANTRIRLATARKKESIKKLNAISERAFARFEEAHKTELKKLGQYDEMVKLFKSMNGVMEAFGLSTNPTNKRLAVQLEAARKAHAVDVAELKKENAELKVEAERAKIRSAVDRMTKTMTESERSEFLTIVAEMKVVDSNDFLRRATKIKDRLYKEDESSYTNFVERFTESADLVRKPKQVNEDKSAPKNIMEAVSEVLRG
uniref:Uncharacterized protein n=1 Tax=Rhizobium phage LG08 TaxID=3129229 RepID=A0AAU8HY60_9CAUD